jgi:hypothetical protein
MTVLLAQLDLQGITVLLEPQALLDQVQLEPQVVGGVQVLLVLPDKQVLQEHREYPVLKEQLVRKDLLVLLDKQVLLELVMCLAQRVLLVLLVRQDYQEHLLVKAELVLQEFRVLLDKQVPQVQLAQVQLVPKD